MSSAARHTSSMACQVVCSGIVLIANRMLTTLSGLGGELLLDLREAGVGQCRAVREDQRGHRLVATVDGHHDVGGQRVVLDVDHLVGDALPVHLVLQATAVAAPDGAVHRDQVGRQGGGASLAGDRARGTGMVIMPGTPVSTPPVRSCFLRPARCGAVHTAPAPCPGPLRGWTPCRPRPPPTTCSPLSTRSSARSPPRCRGRCTCWRAPAPARPAPSPPGSRTACSAASTCRSGCWP